MPADNRIDAYFRVHSVNDAINSLRKKCEQGLFDCAIDHYLARGRYYHGLYHIAQMTRLHQLLSHESLGAIKFTKDEHSFIYHAILYHDVVLDPLRHDNEDKSAEMFLRNLELYNEQHFKDSSSTPRVKERDLKKFSSEIKNTTNTLSQRVNAMILATKDHFAPSGDDRLVDYFVDLDLASLAVNADEFKQNTLALRAEFSMLTDKEWMAGRGKFLKKINEMLDAGGYIYRTAVFQGLFEERARQNVRASCA